jgi:hypothetical protein
VISGVLTSAECGATSTTGGAWVALRMEEPDEPPELGIWCPACIEREQLGRDMRRKEARGDG